MRLEIDHVIVRVEDLDRAEERFHGEFGLASVAGGQHPGHGTANRIIPLGDNYLEMVSVVDRDEAATTGFGNWVANCGVGFPSFDALCLRTDNLEGICSRLHLEPFAMGRKRPDGVELRWRLAGLENAIAEGLPFFIQWDVPAPLLPGRVSVSHPSGARRISKVVVSGEVEKLQAWVGSAEGVVFEQGPTGIVSLTIETREGEINLAGAGS